jgi:5-hydroxyisourate hydrolase
MSNEVTENSRSRRQPAPHRSGLQTMGHLSTHVLDTAHGCPAEGMQVSLQRLDPVAPGGTVTLRSLALDADGRTGGPLLDADSMAVGQYRLVFAVAPYFRARGVALPEPPFIDVVQLDFGIADAQGHYHVPLLCSPWSYSTYRGS